MTALEPGLEPAARVAGRPAWLVLAVGILFGLFYAWDVWEAVNNLVGVVQLARVLDATITAVGWAVLVTSILLPLVLFAAAFWIARRRPIAQLAAVLFVGLCVSAALWFDLLAGFGFANLIA